jgi:hypothetical protein
MHDDDSDRQSDEHETDPSVVYERHEREVRISEGTAVVRDEHEQVIEPAPSEAPEPAPPSAPAEERAGKASVSEGDPGELGDRILGPPDE